MEGYGASHYESSNARRDMPLGILIGFAFSILLFAGMALAQMLGSVKPPSNEFEETLVALPAPEIEDFEEPEPEPEEEPEPEPELQEQPPDLTLEQLDIALSPGTGSLAGDFSLPTFDAGKSDLSLEDMFDFSDLDSEPTLVNFRLNWPRKLLTRKVSGTVVLMIQIGETGAVQSVEVESADVPDRYTEYLVEEFGKARYTPPTKGGRPVSGARGRQTIPVNIGT